VKSFCSARFPLHMGDRSGKRCFERYRLPRDCLESPPVARALEISLPFPGSPLIREGNAEGGLGAAGGSRGACPSPALHSSFGVPFAATLCRPMPTTCGSFSVSSLAARSQDEANRFSPLTTILAAEAFVIWGFFPPKSLLPQPLAYAHSARLPACLPLLTVAFVIWSTLRLVTFAAAIRHLGCFFPTIRCQTRHSSSRVPLFVIWGSFRRRKPRKSGHRRVFVISGSLLSAAFVILGCGFAPAFVNWGAICQTHSSFEVPFAAIIRHLRFPPSA
jgi:hypothetical protein